jgi:hypothetical protein
MTAFWEMAPCSLVEVDRLFRGLYGIHHQGDFPEVRWVGLLIALTMEAVRTYKTLVYFSKTTRRHLPDSGHLQACRGKNLKSGSSKEVTLDTKNGNMLIRRIWSQLVVVLCIKQKRHSSNRLRWFKPLIPKTTTELIQSSSQSGTNIAEIILIFLLLPYSVSSQSAGSEMKPLT